MRKTTSVVSRGTGSSTWTNRTPPTRKKVGDAHIRAELSIALWKVVLLCVL